MSIINNPNAALTVGDRLIQLCIRNGFRHKSYLARWKKLRAYRYIEEPITSTKYQEYELDWWEIK